MKKKTVSFSLTQQEHDWANEYLRKKGLTLSQFAKFSMFQYMQKYPGKKKQNPTPRVSPETDAVQPYKGDELTGGSP